MKTLRVDGKLFHSGVAPEKEAQRLAQSVQHSSHVIVLSPGLGYLRDAIIAMSASDPRQILCFERHPEIAVLRADLRPVVGATPDEVYDIVRSLDGIEAGLPNRQACVQGKISILTGIFLESDREYYESLRKAITQAIEKSAEEILTSRAFAEQWERNLRINAEKFSNAAWLPEIASRLRGRTVIILAAGPTLREDLAALRDFQGEKNRKLQRIIVIATDTAVPAAVNAGVALDFCCTIDPQPIKAASLEHLGAVSLIASVLSPPETIDRAQKVIFFGQGHPLEREHGVPSAAVIPDTGGSVATAAATLAVHCGAICVVLVGQDLAYLGGESHVKGALPEEQAVKALSRFRSVERDRMSRMTNRNLHSVASVDGKTVMTTPVMDSYRFYFERLARENPRVRFVQTSRRGARIEIEHSSLTEVLLQIGSNADKNEMKTSGG